LLEAFDPDGGIVGRFENRHLPLDAVGEAQNAMQMPWPP